MQGDGCSTLFQIVTLGFSGCNRDGLEKDGSLNDRVSRSELKVNIVHSDRIMLPREFIPMFLTADLRFVRRYGGDTTPLA